MSSSQAPSGVPFAALPPSHDGELTTSQLRPSDISICALSSMLGRGDAEVTQGS